jgi:hypothetical protein
VARRRNQPLLDQAQTNAFLRYQPELDALTAAIRAAQANRRTTVRTARSAAEGVYDSVEDALPDAKRIYRQAGRQQMRTADTLIGTDLQGLDGAANSIVAGAALEQAAAGNRIEQARADTLSGLREMQVQAKAGEQFAVNNAQRQFTSDLKEILAARRSLGSQQGAFLASEIARLVGEKKARQLQLQLNQQDNATSRANTRANNRTSRQNNREDNATSERNNRRSNSGSGSGGSDINATADDYQTADEQITRALRLARTLDPDRNARRDAAGLLINGVDPKEGELVYDPVTNRPVLNPDGTQKRTGGRPGIDPIDAIWVQAALDQYYLGGLSRRTRQRLRQQGFKIGRLPVRPRRRPRPNLPGPGDPAPASPGSDAAQP